jgi:hypothetical protein
MLGLVPKVHGEECSNATLKGSFGFSGSGSFAGTTPFVAIGRISFDGTGNLEGTASVSNGTTVFRFPFSGTYTVNSDCTGSNTFSDGTHSDIVIDDDGTEIRFIRTDAGILNSGVGRKQFPGRHPKG